jgi:hypothetical protein
MMGNLNVSMSEEQMAALHAIADDDLNGNTSALIRALLAKHYVTFRRAKTGPKNVGGRPPKRRHEEFLKEKRIGGFTLMMAQRPDGT